jgi:hypothetical protein
VVAASRAISYNEVRGAWFRVDRVETFVIDSRDGYGINTICISIKIALVTIPGTIATSKDENGSLSITAALDAIQHRTLNEVARALHGLAVIGRAPRAAVDWRILVVVVESSGLIDVGNGAGEDADACDFGIVRDPHAADIILHCANLACATGAMMVLR